MELTQIINRIDFLKEEIEKLRPIDAETENRIWQKYRLDWNFHSNNIEGNSLTFGETKSFLLHGITAQGKPLKDHLDIKGHNEAILLLEDIVKNQHPLTESYIRGLHEIILHEPYERPAVTPDGQPTTKKIEIGKYKTSPNHVKTATGEVFYFATPEETPAKMQELLEWYRSETEKGELHPLIIAAEFHYRFVRIHPFDDGNGRLSRILMNLTLMKFGFPPVIIKTGDKANYLRALQMADGGNMEAFYSYIGEQLISSEELYLKGARGEDIEEPDDLDKEIMLLKAKLDSETQNKTLFSQNSISEISNSIIKPMLENIILKVQPFDELFETHLIYFHGASQVMNIGIMNINSILEHIIANFATRSYSVSFNWNTFIKGSSSFNTYRSINIFFQNYNCEIKINGGIQFLQFIIPYDNFEESIFKEIAMKFTKDVLNEIKDKLN